MATDWDTIITKLETAINARLDGGRGVVDAYNVRGRDIQFMDVEELRAALQWAKRSKARARTGHPFAIGLGRRPGR